MPIDMSIHVLARARKKIIAEIINYQRFIKTMIACLLIKHFYSWGRCTFYDLLRWIAMNDF